MVNNVITSGGLIFKKIDFNDEQNTGDITLVIMDKTNDYRISPNALTYLDMFNALSEIMFRSYGRVDAFLEAQLNNQYINTTGWMFLVNLAKLVAITQSEEKIFQGKDEGLISNLIVTTYNRENAKVWNQFKISRDTYNEPQMVDGRPLPLDEGITAARKNDLDELKERFLKNHTPNIIDGFLTPLYKHPDILFDFCDMFFVSK